MCDAEISTAALTHTLRDTAIPTAQSHAQAQGTARHRPTWPALVLEPALPPPPALATPCCSICCCGSAAPLAAPVGTGGSPAAVCVGIGSSQPASSSVSAQQQTRLTQRHSTAQSTGRGLRQQQSDSPAAAVHVPPPSSTPAAMPRQAGTPRHRPTWPAMVLEREPPPPAAPWALAAAPSCWSASPSPCACASM